MLTGSQDSNSDHTHACTNSERQVASDFMPLFSSLTDYRDILSYNTGFPMNL